MKLTLWIAEQTEDYSCYNLVSKTRTQLLKDIGANHNSVAFKKVYKIEIEYTDAFRLFMRATGECGGRSPHGYHIVSAFKIVPNKKRPGLALKKLTVD